MCLCVAYTEALLRIETIHTGAIFTSSAAAANVTYALPHTRRSCKSHSKLLGATCIVV